MNPWEGTPAALDTVIGVFYESGITLKELNRQIEKAWLIRVLTDCKGNQCKAALRMHMHRSRLADHLKRLGLDARSFAPNRQVPRNCQREQSADVGGSRSDGMMHGTFVFAMCSLQRGLAVQCLIAWAIEEMALEALA